MQGKKSASSHRESSREKIRPVFLSTFSCINDPDWTDESTGEGAWEPWGGGEWSWAASQRSPEGQTGRSTRRYYRAQLCCSDEKFDLARGEKLRIAHDLCVYIASLAGRGIKLRKREFWKDSRFQLFRYAIARSTWVNPPPLPDDPSRPRSVYHAPIGLSRA